MMIESTTADVYDTAFLAGGRYRVIDTALAVLLESGRIRARRSGELAVVDPSRRHEVEAAVLDAVGPDGWRTAAMVRLRAGTDERVTRIGDRLVNDGLLCGRPSRRRTRAGRRALRRLRAQLPPGGRAAASSAARVAVHGPGEVPDAEVRKAVFDPPRPRYRPGGTTCAAGGYAAGGCAGAAPPEVAAAPGTVAGVVAVAELGVGIGWRPEIELTVERLAGVDFVEVVAESVCADHLPESLRLLRARGVPVLPHGVELSLGSAEPPDPARLARLARLAVALDAPLVSEHVAFVRAGGREAGHLLPVPRTRDALEVVVANVRAAQAALPVPLAVENVAALFGWPTDELTDGEFLAELVERTGVRLLVDVANLHTNAVNLGLDPIAALDRLPLEAVAYVHVAGGVLRDGVWHDTHAHPVPRAVLDLLAAVCERASVPGALLEQDAAYPSDAALAAELRAIRWVLAETPYRGSDVPRVATTAPWVPLRAARDRLAAAEEALLAGLAGGRLPAGFDAERIDLQAGALLAKRRELVARRRPDLADAVGFRARFDAYAAVHPRPAAGSRADADAFARLG